MLTTRNNKLRMEIFRRREEQKKFSKKIFDRLHQSIRCPKSKKIETDSSIRSLLDDGSM